MISFAAPTDCNCLSSLSTLVWLETYSKAGITKEHSEYVASNLSPESFEQLLASDSHKIVVAKKDNAIVGLSVIDLASHFKSESFGFEIQRLYVHPSFRTHGIGRELLSFITNEIGCTFWLYTWIQNASNTFYEKLGFRKVGKLCFNFGTEEVVNNVYTSVDT